VKIVVLGAAGEVGRALTEDLAVHSEADEIIATDLDGRSVAAMADEFGPRVSAVEVDVHDRERSLGVLEGADLLMNCTSFLLAREAFGLAAAARVNYADLISEPTEADRRLVEEAGITAISGLGATPGLSNVLVAHAAGELEKIEEVHVSWASFRTIAPSRGLLDTILWELADDCPTRRYFQSGRHHRARFMEGSRVVEFAEPVGMQRVYYVPHPEVETVPRNFSTLSFCAVRGTWRPELMADFAVLNRYGLLDGGAVEATKEQIWRRFGGRRDDSGWYLFVQVEVIAVRENGEATRRVYNVHHPLDWRHEATGRMTGVCAAVGAQLLARRGTSRAGFVDPEVYYDPNEYLAELEKRRSVSVEWTDSLVTDRELEPTPI
jgi:saccharopine dehydrogenase-like NADP-dependent oxidoreductase